MRVVCTGIQLRCLAFAIVYTDVFIRMGGFLNDVVDTMRVGVGVGVGVCVTLAWYGLRCMVLFYRLPSQTVYHAAVEIAPVFIHE